MKRTTGRLKTWLTTLLLPLLGCFACAQQEAIVFGVVLPLSGDSAIYGESIKNGIELALDRLQAEYPEAADIKLDVRDSESDPERARELADELYNDGVRAIIGGVTTPEAMTMVEVADRSNRVLVSPSASAASLTGISRNFYRVWPSDAREGSKMGQYAAQNLNLKTAVILAADSAYAEGIQSVFQDSFKQNGGEILDALIYPANTEDLDALIERTISLAPDAVYIADYADGIVRVLTKLKQQGYEGKILTVAAFATSPAIAAAGRDAEGVFVTHPQFSPDDAANVEVQEFVNAYTDEFGETPGLYAAHGYDAMVVAYQAIQEGGDRGSSFWKGLRGINDLTGVTGPLQFDDKGDVQKWPRVYFLVDGKLVDHSDWVDDQKERLRKRMEELRRQRDQLRGN